MNNPFPDCRGLTKPHFAFCRMYVYVDGRGIELETEKGDWVMPFHEGGMIALADSCCEKPTFDGATIYKDKLLRPRLAAQSRLTNKSTYADVLRSRVVYLNKALQQLSTIQIANPITERRRR